VQLCALRVGQICTCDSSTPPLKRKKHATRRTCEHFPGRLPDTKSPPRPEPCSPRPSSGRVFGGCWSVCWSVLARLRPRITLSERWEGAAPARAGCLKWRRGGALYIYIYIYIYINGGHGVCTARALAVATCSCAPGEQAHQDGDQSETAVGWCRICTEIAFGWGRGNRSSTTASICLPSPMAKP